MNILKEEETQKLFFFFYEMYMISFLFMPTFCCTSFVLLYDWVV
jgi:hypothetical protein